MSKSQEETWTTIESDPGVFTELMQQMGVNDVQVEELYSLDAATLDSLRPCYGLIFLFKWSGHKDDRKPDLDAGNAVFFARQIITNACATQALLSVLLNCPGINLGPELSHFKEFTKDFTPDMKGVAIGSSEVIRRVHNSFALPTVFLPEESRKAEKDDDVYHFVAYVPIEGALYELDGLKSGPIRLDSFDPAEDNWMHKVSPHIARRIQQYNQEEIRFNLMVVVRNRQKVYDERLAELEARKAALEAEVQNALEEGQAQAGAGSSDVLSEILQLEEEIQGTRSSKEADAEKVAKWRNENIRRKHNYIPFLFNFLKVLAEGGKLTPLIEAAAGAKS